MAQKLSRAQRKEQGISLHPKTGCWIKYLLDLRKITYKTVAAKAGLSSDTSISRFLACRNNSPRIRQALAEILGYPSFEALIASSRGKGDAA